jgi:hypothetical protein
VPAHLNGDWVSLPEGMKARSLALPDADEPAYIDLFAAETGALLAWVSYFLGDLIGNSVPQVKARMEREVERRLLSPFLRYDTYRWSGLAHKEPVNNWNPWINSNLLATYLIFAESFPRFQEGAAKTVESINRFIHFYAEDGGCDEGPHYFDAAGASLFDFIEELGQITDVSYLYAQEKIRNIAAYIYQAYIGNRYFVNYADSGPETPPPAGLLERTARRTGDETLKAFAGHLRENGICGAQTEISRIGSMQYRLLANIFTASDCNAGEKSGAFQGPAVSWFSGIQVVTARDADFFFSAKGGHNNESHNHNDIGNFLLYVRGKPAIIDAGVETYTKFTFNEKRYTLWTMRSRYHNVPEINGFEQAPGKQYRAEGVSFAQDRWETRFALDIASAYPAEAEIAGYRREFVFRYGEGLTVTDEYRFKRRLSPLVLHLLCYEKPELSEGTIRFAEDAVLYTDPQTLTAETETITLADPKIRRDWQKDALYRLKLTCPSGGVSGRIILRFKKQP